MTITEHKRKRDVSIELCRIIACLMVISLHLSLEAINGNALNIQRQFVNSLFFDGATIFWIISGFFVFLSNYKKTLIKNVGRLYIPTIVISIISYLVYDYYQVKNGVIPSMRSVGLYLTVFFKGIISLRNFAPSCSHLWYIYIYMMVQIISPLLKKFADFINENKKREIIYLITLFFILVVNEVTANYFGFGTHHFGALIPASLIVLYGNILYNNIDYIKNKLPNLFVLFGCYLVIGAIRLVLYNYHFVNGIADISSNWFSVFSVMCATLIIFFIFQVGKNIQGNLESLVLFVSSKVLFVYIIHPFVIKFLSKTGVYNSVLLYMQHNNNLVIEFLFLVVSSIVVLFICLIISEAFGLFKNLVNTKKRIN